MERFVDLIHDKKSGKELSDESIRGMIKGFTKGDIPDYQMSAMLMAICYEGLNDRELTTMTLAMRDSGTINDLSAIDGIKVDKHSTGGVGDKTTLIIGPIAASCGIPIAKMSGRGLGFTGGTIDKLESIPGFHTDLSTDAFFEAVKKTDICVNGQTADLAPADKKIYALRDATATVESIPLIASSVMSKKLASGSDCIVLDVTTGNGAFMKDRKQALELAKKMVTIGNLAGKKTIAQLTSMEEPLGFAVGNNLEVKEAIDALHGNGPEDLMTVCYTLAAHMISLGKNISCEVAVKEAKESVESGRAFDTFVKMVEMQGGDTSYILSPETFPVSPVQAELKAPNSGYLTYINTEGVGTAAGILGAGRNKKEDDIDPCAGIILHKKLGQKVEIGESIATLYTSDKSLLDAGIRHLETCYEIKDVPESVPELIQECIS